MVFSQLNRSTWRHYNQLIVQTTYQIHKHGQAAGFEPAPRLPVFQTGCQWISTGNFHDDGFNISYVAVIDVCNFGCEQAFLLIFIDLVMSYERESLSIGELLHRNLQIIHSDQSTTHF